MRHILIEKHIDYTSEAIDEIDDVVLFISNKYKVLYDSVKNTLCVYEKGANFDNILHMENYYSKNDDTLLSNDFNSVKRNWVDRLINSKVKSFKISYLKKYDNPFDSFDSLQSKKLTNEKYELFLSEFLFIINLCQIHLKIQSKKNEIGVLKLDPMLHFTLSRVGIDEMEDLFFYMPRI